MLEPEVTSTLATSIQARSELHRDDDVLDSDAWSISRADDRAEAADALDALDAMRVHSVLLRRIAPNAVADASCDSRLTVPASLGAFGMLPAGAALEVIATPAKLH